MTPLQRQKLREAEQNFSFYDDSPRPDPFPERHPILKSLAERESEREEDRCPDCGQTPEEGACFYCKAD